VNQGHNLPDTWESSYQGDSSDPRDLTASRSNTNKHGIDKINITPNISTNLIIMIYAKLRDRGIETTKIGVTIKELWFYKRSMWLKYWIYYKLVNINHKRGYSINNYLNFNLSYKLAIDHILVDYNDKQINKTNQHKLNKDLIIKEWNMAQYMLLLRSKYLYETNATWTDQIGVKTRKLWFS
jgi:hypothetical protein